MASAATLRVVALLLLASQAAAIMPVPELDAGTAPAALANATYDPTLALRAVYFSAATYCKSTLMSWTCPTCKFVSGVVPLKMFEDTRTTTFGYIAIDTEAQRIVISFKGSTNIPDWISDLNFTREDYPPIKGALVHKGFYDAWLTVRDSVLAEVATARQNYGNLPVLTTGHSLGAALAFWAAVEIKGTIYYSFGEPRIGNRLFVDAVKPNFAELWRLVHALDPVPHLPPIDFFYWHAPTEVWYEDQTGTTNYRICDQSGEDPTCSDKNLNYDSNDHLTYLDVLVRQCE